MIGQHIIAEFYGVKPELIKNTDSLKPILEKSVEESKLEKICSKYHDFEPFGVTGFVLLAESHIAVHTWPEYGLVTIDMFTCDRKNKIFKAFDVLLRELKPEKVKKVFEGERGIEIPVKPLKV